jgi:dsDNA-specific endonuclease/ATPase MutS2
MSAYKQLLQQFFKEKSKLAIQSVFKAQSFDSLDDNIESISTAYGNIMADQSAELYDIIDKLIDHKLNTAKVSYLLSNSGGAVAGEIKIISQPT